MQLRCIDSDSRDCELRQAKGREVCEVNGMKEFRFTRAFEGDAVNIIPIDKDTANQILEIPPHTIFSLFSKDGTRTSKQQAAIEVYCRLLAEALNEAGYDMIAFPWREGVEVPWSQATVKDKLWRPLQEVVLGKKSTTKLDKPEVNEIYEILARDMARRCGVSVPFPSKDDE